MGLSREDLRFMDMVTKSAKHTDGHYQVTLPLKNSNISIPNNWKVVEQCLYHLKRRLQRDPVFYREYNTFINDLIGKGYAERVERVFRGKGTKYQEKQSPVQVVSKAGGWSLACGRTAQ